jgi:hypothetical protein
MRAVVLSLLLCSAAVAGPADAVAVATDLGRLPENDRLFAAYFVHPVPVEADKRLAFLPTLDEFHDVFSFHVNQLSSKGAILRPTRIAPHIWRADLRHYGWKRSTWDKMAPANYAYVESERKKRKVLVNGRRVTRIFVKDAVAHWVPTDAADFLVSETGTVTPIVSAPWFLANTCRQLTLTNQQLGFGYYDWFGVKKPQDFLKLIRFREKDSLDLERDILEVVDDSGVSKQNRMIALHIALTGLVCYTLDTDNETGAGNAIANLQRNAFKPKAREWYFVLLNGLPGYMLSDDDLKELQASAPDFIGADKSPLNQSIDPRIHVCLACIRCHAGDVLKPVDGWARKNFTLDKLGLMVPALFKGADPDEQFRIFEELKRQYLVLNFSNSLNVQRTAYRASIKEACGMEPGPLAVAFAKHYHAYADKPVTLEMAAAELGYTVADTRAAFRRAGDPGGYGIPPELAALALAKEQPMKRLKWEENYAEAQRIMLADKGKP